MNQIDDIVGLLHLDDLIKLRQKIDERIDSLNQRAKADVDDDESNLYYQLNQKIDKLLSQKSIIDHIDYIKEIVHDAYVSLPFDVRWSKSILEKPEYGHLPHCSSNDCWFSRNRDRLREYNGTYYSLVIDEDVGFCENCVEDMCDEECDAIDRNMINLIDGYDYYRINQLKQSNPKNAPSFIRLLNSKGCECNVCKKSDPDFLFYCNTNDQILCDSCKKRMIIFFETNDCSL